MEPWKYSAEFCSAHVNKLQINIFADTDFLEFWKQWSISLKFMTVGFFFKAHSRKL